MCAKKNALLGGRLVPAASPKTKQAGLVIFAMVAKAVRTAAACMILTTALVAAAAPRAPPLVAQPKPAKRMVFGSAEYKAAVPRTALLRHVLLTHVSYVLSVGLVQTAVYSCLPYLKDSGVLTQRQISRMLTVGTACFVVGKLSTAQILDLVGPKAAFITNMLIGSLLCFTIAFGAPGIAAEVCWGVYKLWSATSWPSVVQMLAYWSGRRDSVKAFALYSTASRTGAIVASLGVGVLMRRSERGWQIALCGTGVATLLVFLLCKGVVDETPARVLGPNVTAASALEPPRAHPLVRTLRLRVRRLEAGWRQQFLDRQRQRNSPPLWRSESAGPDDAVHLKPAALLHMFAGRANFCARRHPATTRRHPPPAPEPCPTEPPHPSHACPLLLRPLRF